MTPVELIAKWLLDTHTNSANYDPATDWLDALNIVSDYINNQIVQSVREDYFWDRVKVNTVADQWEYDITTASINWKWTADTSVNIKKISKLFVKYEDTDYYTPVEYLSPELLEKDPEWYEDNQSVANPFYYIQDRSIFIYPKPTEITTQWLKMQVIYSPPAIAYDSEEVWLPLQKDKHYIYALGIQEQIYKSQNKDAEAANAKAIFKAELIETLSFMKSRTTQPRKKVITNLDNYR